MANLEITGGVTGPGRIGRVAIGDILRKSARRFADRIALTDGGWQASFTELDRDANRFANHLIARGLKPGEKVSTICNNSIELVKVLFGIHRAGLVWVPVNTMLGAEDMDYILDHAGVGVALIDDNLHAQPERRAVLEKRGMSLIAIELAGTGASGGLGTFAGAIESQPDIEPEMPVDERDLAMIIYTSGTTSRPKGAMHCHLAVVMSVMSNIIEWLAVGGKMAIMRGFDPLVCMEAIERDKRTVFVGLSLMYQAILDHPRRQEFDLSTLTTCIYTMAPMGRPLLERGIKELCRNFVLTSGQTEMYPITTMSQPDRQLERFGNFWGESMIVNETAIMDDDGNLLPPGQAGELVHRGPNVMLGYYKDPVATEAVRKFGWHHTGDLALIDEHREVSFLDRKKDMIKSGGENIASVKVEEALVAHAAVLNAAVVGLPHPQWGEAVTAFVKLKPGAHVDESVLIDHCRMTLGGFQVPKAVVVVEEMPVTATGKLRKVELRQMHLDHFSR